MNLKEHQNRRLIGSLTAKGGFANEKLIAEKFNRYRKDSEAKKWLEFMGYNPDKIQDLQANVIPVKISQKKAQLYGLDLDKLGETLKFKKSDIQVRIQLIYENVYFVENITVKKANEDADYNQVDKRKVDDYMEMWGFDSEIALWLKYFTGELPPPLDLNIQKRDPRRLFLDEMPDTIQKRIVEFFSDNKMLIACDVLKGRGALAANWFLVAKYVKKDNITYFGITNINVAINFFSQGNVKISPKGNLNIGKITMQRKGGTPDPTKLQFKIKPCRIFQPI